MENFKHRISVLTQPEVDCYCKKIDKFCKIVEKNWNLPYSSGVELEKLYAELEVGKALHEWTLKENDLYYRELKKLMTKGA